MNLSQHLAKHLRDVHYGGNWTCVNLKDSLEGLNFEQANTRVHGFNSIVTLLYHLDYYFGVVTRVLEGGPVEGKDADSFVHPPVTSEADWQALKDKLFADAERVAALVAELPEEKIWATFGMSDKYGNCYRNIQGMTEHLHYHLGQIVLIRKMVTAAQSVAAGTAV